MLERIERALLARLPLSMTGRLRARRVHRLIRTFPARVVEHTYGGGPLNVYLADPLAREWYDHDWPELPEVAALRRTRLRPGARVFDVGAHHGVVAMMLAREVGPTGQVVALEPSPHNAAAARKNRELNRMDHLEIVQAAVSNRTGTVVFNQELNGQLDDGTGAGGRVMVPSLTIDGLAERYGMPDVVVLDIEGAECLALAAAQRVLDAGADFCVEVHVDCGLEKLGGSVERILSSFPEDRFTLLARAEGDEAFRSFRPYESITQARFYLLALTTPTVKVERSCPPTASGLWSRR